MGSSFHKPISKFPFDSHEYQNKDKEESDERKNGVRNILMRIWILSFGLLLAGHVNNLVIIFYFLNS